MNNPIKLLLGGMAASLILGLSACSDNDTTPASQTVTEPTIMDPLSAQTATIVINDPNGTPTVTVPTQANDITLSGAATIPGAGQLDIVLNATNDAPRILTNLKAVVDSVAADTGATPTVSGSSGTYNTKDYTFFSSAIAQGDDVDAPVLQISGIDGAATTVTVEVAMPTDHPIIAMSRWNGNTELQLVDSATGDSTFFDSAAVAPVTAYRGDNDIGGGFDFGVGSVDGTRIYTGSRTRGSLMIIDLTKINDTDAEPFSTMKISELDVANIYKVVMNASATALYALVSEGGHRPNDVDGGWNLYSNETYTRLVKIDLETMSVDGSVEMMRNTAMARAKDIDIADDDVTAAVVNNANGVNQIDIVDLGSMTVTKSIPVNLENNFQQQLRSVAISGDGSTVYAMYKDSLHANSELLVIDVESGAIQKIFVDADIEQPHEMDFGPDGWLYVASDEGLFRYNVDTQQVFVFDTDDFQVNKLVFNRAGDTVYTSTRSSVSPARGYAFDVDSGERLDTDGDDTDGIDGHLTLPENSAYGHFYVLTTY